jgi:protease PrsW
MHGTTLAILAAVAHELAERETRQSAGDFDFNLLWFLPGYLVAVALHTAFNQFPDRPMLAMMAAVIFAPIAIIAIFHFGTAEAERWLAAESAAHEAQFEALKAGQWPEGPSGRKIAALAERLAPENATRVRRFWELQAWLVAQAEAAMMEEAAGDVSIDKEQVAAAFAELEGLRRALGKSTYTALKALLPFSRNDYWEVSELRQRLS